MNGECEMDGCSAPAVGNWFAQWTIADFLDVEACDEHSDLLGLWLQSLTVDGFDTVELMWTDYETPSLPT